jgi:hypothetical protein
VNFRPKDQIVLLAGLDDAVRARIWAVPELRESVERLHDAGFLEGENGARGHEFVPRTLSEPAGMAAARGLRHITLDDLLGEHLPDWA